jgi:hypothetical protein
MSRETAGKFNGRCKRCKRVLLSTDEIESGVCDPCADALYENSEARRDWGRFHDEPMPDIELPHPPKTDRQ